MFVSEICQKMFSLTAEDIHILVLSLIYTSQSFQSEKYLHIEYVF